MTATPEQLAVYYRWRAAQAEAERLVQANRDAEAVRLLQRAGGLLIEDARRDVQDIRWRVFRKEIA